MKFDPINRLRKVWRRLSNKATETVRHFGKQTDQVLSEEPIDFSAPSIPYYENLANRLSFVRVVLYMVLFVFVVVTVISNHNLITYENLYYLGKDIGAATLTAQSEANYLSYPVSSADADFALYRGGVVVAGSEVVTAMSGSGRQTLSVNVDYARPMVRASDKYVITFGRGENSFAVYNAFVQVHREDTDFPVYDAVVADNGHYAIITRSRDYTSEVIIYDGDMERLANYHLNGYVTGVSMNSDGTALGIVSVEAKEGQWETKVSLIRIGKRISEESVTLSGIMGSQCGFTADERLAVIFSDRLVVFKAAQDLSVVSEEEFKGGTPALCTIGQGRIAVLLQSSGDLSDSLLMVYDRHGHTAYSLTMKDDHPIHKAGGASQMAFGGNVLYIRAGDTLFRLSGEGKDMTSATISRDTLAYLPESADEVLVCTPAYAVRITKGEFK